MKKITILFLIFCLYITSCDKEEMKNVEIVEEVKTIDYFEFSDVEELEKQELKYRKIRDEIDFNLSNNFMSSTNTDTKEKDVEIFLISELKKFHTSRLTEIYNMREAINFTSIQSIVDEINSLKLISPEDAKTLYEKYSDNLEKSINGNIIKVAQHIANPNITNAEGVLLFDNVNINAHMNNDATKQEERKNNNYLKTSSIAENNDFSYSSKRADGTTTKKVSALGLEVEIMIEWGAGISVTNYVLWTRQTPYTYYRSYYKFASSESSNAEDYDWIEIPSNFTPNANSDCGFFATNFVASGREQFVDFPSGTGTSIRNDGDTKTGNVQLWESINPSGTCSTHMRPASQIFNTLPPVLTQINVERIYLHIDLP